MVQNFVPHCLYDSTNCPVEVASFLKKILDEAKGKSFDEVRNLSWFVFFVGNVSVKGYSTPPNFLSLEKGTFKKEMNHLYNPTIIFQGIFFQLS